MSDSDAPAPMRALDAEQGAIGVALVDPSRHRPALRPSLSEPGLAEIHDAMTAEIERGATAADLLLLVGTATKDIVSVQQLGGMSYLADLYDKAPVGADTDRLCRSVHEAAWRRQRASIITGGGTPDPSDLADLEAGLREIDRLWGGKAGAGRLLREPFESIQPSAHPYRVKGALPSRGVAYIAGASGTKKTFLAVDICLGLASGHAKVLNRRARSCGVAYIAAEDPDGCRARVALWRKERGRSDAPTPFELVSPGINLLDADQVADLKATLQDIGRDFSVMGSPLGVIVVDTLSKCIPGADENSSTDMSMAVEVLEAIARESDALIIVVAHFGKGGSDKGIRGWSGLGFNADAVISVERDADDPEVSTLTLAKVKNGPDGEKLSFRLEIGGLGLLDEDGEEITSGVVVYEGAAEAKAKPKRVKPLTPPEELVCHALRQLGDGGGAVTPPPLDGVKAHHKAVTKDTLRDRVFSSGFADEGEKRNTRNVRFNRIVESLAGKGKLRVEGELLWLV